MSESAAPSVGQRVVIAGAGDLARELTHLIRKSARPAEPPPEICYYVDVDRAPALAGEIISGDVSNLLRRCPPDRWTALVGLMDPFHRARFYGQLSKLGYRFATVVSPAANVDTSSIGEGSIVFENAHIALEARIGVNCLVYYHCTVSHDACLGNHSAMAPHSVLGGRVIGGERVLYGLGATILPRVTVGDGAKVAAGSSVWADVPAGITVAGIPARPLFSGRPPHSDQH